MMKKLLKKSIFVAILSFSFATLHAQTPLVHLSFEGNLTATGSAGLTFQIYDPSNFSLVLPYGSGKYGDAINYTAIDNATNNVNFIQNGVNYPGDIRSTTNLSITGSAARTVSAWVRYDNKNTSTNGTHCILNTGNPAASASVDIYGRVTFQLAAANNRLQVAIAGGTVNADYDPNAAGSIEDGNWHHVAFTYPAGGTLGDVIIYIDGVAVADDNGTTASSAVLNTTSDLVYIGSKGDQTLKWFDGGGIDDLRIYGSALTASQILAIYNNTLSTKGFAFGELKAYPNAVEDYLYLETSSNSLLQVSVFDITGKNIIKTSGNSVDMRGLTSGLYIVKVAQDNKVANLKILKK